jgi:hypothetical protein
MAGLTVLDMYYQAEAEYRRSLLFRAAGQHILNRELKTARRAHGSDWGWTSLATASRVGSDEQSTGGSHARGLYRLWNLLRDGVAEGVSAALTLVQHPQR